MYNDEISDEAKKEYFEMNLKVAEIGLVESMSEIAGMYFKGFGVEKNFDEAIKWLKKATDEGDEFATIALGDIYSNYSEYKNTAKAIFYLSKAAEQNNIKAIAALAAIYERQKDFEKMFECCQKGANLGNRYLMERLAYCYLFGRGIPQDDFQALDWFIKIIELYGWDCFKVIEFGSLDEEYNNNIMRMVTKIYSKHFKFTDKKFLKFYVTTEKLGIFNAIFGIASELYKTDKIRALKWYKIAADAGDFDAAVAVFYIKAEVLNATTVVDSDRGKFFSALEWYKKAVDFGNINAAKNLLMWKSIGFHRFSLYFDGGIPIYYLKRIVEMEGHNLNV